MCALRFISLQRDRVAASRERGRARVGAIERASERERARALNRNREWQRMWVVEKALPQRAHTYTYTLALAHTHTHAHSCARSLCCFDTLLYDVVDLNFFVFIRSNFFLLCLFRFSHSSLHVSYSMLRFAWHLTIGMGRAVHRGVRSRRARGSHRLFSAYN